MSPWGRQGIVIACDVPTLDELHRLVSSTSALDAITAFKVGFSLSIRYGLPAVVERIRRLSAKPVIYDHQKGATDIPETGSVFAQACAESGVDGVILFPHSGPTTLEAWIQAILGVGLVPIVGAVMTHPRFLISEGGFISDDASASIYEQSLAAGVRDFVLPATKPEQADLLKEKAAATRSVGRLCVLAPGIGRQGADIAAVRESFSGLCWSAIVGSALYEAEDPGHEAVRLAKALFEDKVQA